MTTPPLNAWLFLMLLHVYAISGHYCLSHQQSLLLQFKNTLTFKAINGAQKLLPWNQTSDCCTWEGITCQEGLVIGLKLSNKSISGGIFENSTLFELENLKSLDLSLNNFESEIPSRIGNLTGLRYLNFSGSGFVGQIPKEISLLTRLVILDFSTLSYFGPPLMKLEEPNLSMLVQNLTELEELYLDGVNISAPGNEWGQALSSSLPKLRVLSLTSCLVSGPFDQSLLKLHSLSEIRLDYNNFSTDPVPKFFANFVNLTSLCLRYCELQGTFPIEIFQVPTLKTLDISFNFFLQGSLPEFPHNSALQSLRIFSTNFSARLPVSIGNLRNLSILELACSHFHGKIPNSVTNLTQLVYLDLFFNNFSGPVPSFNMSKNLTHIDLSFNRLTGSIPSAHLAGLMNLVYVDFGYNLLTGNIPSSLFSIPSLQQIILGNNQFSGQVFEFSNPTSLMLDTFDLARNNLHGPIPMSIFKLRELKELSLHANKFNGTIQLHMFQGLSNLISLGLSHNNLSVNVRGNDYNFTSLPKFANLWLASCKLRVFPNLKNQSNLQFLDLSDNHIYGEIPNWIWHTSLILLNLSHNHLVGMQEPYFLPNLTILDLNSNQLQGKIPVLPRNSFYMDLSSNYFSSSIPTDIGDYLTLTTYFSLSNNSLTGVIPKSICKTSHMQVVDFSKNSLSGRIPSCMIAMTCTLVLNLGSNNLSGPITDAFPKNCSLKALDLNGNLLTDRIPKSLAKCRVLEFLDLGNNKMFDSFPLLLHNISTLRVLILRSNKFYGHITCPKSIDAWPVIQIFDVASNNFGGEIPGQCMTKWYAMIAAVDDAKSKLNYLIFKFRAFTSSSCYHVAVTVSNKGLEMEMVKIPTTFTSIDFSSNNFHGQIPKELGQLKSLLVLNLSNNVLSGQIPSSFGNLRQLESLDLSRNHLNGEIPISLSNLNFLSFLNLSYNQLLGRIPTGNQIQTFSADCFEGNEGLCGPPLTPNCKDGVERKTSKGKQSKSGSQIDWDLLSAEFGFLFGFGIVIGPLVFSSRWRTCYFDGLEDIACSILPQVVLRKLLSLQ